MPTREELTQGKTITLNRIVSREKGEGKNRFTEHEVVCEKWTILGTYPHFALLANRYGTRECFSYWEITKYSKFPEKRLDQNGHVRYSW